jgi:hypothetical protein
MKRFLIVAVTVLVFLPELQARAGWEIPGDSRLVVQPGVCDMYSNQNSAYCGPVLSVRVPAFDNGDGVSVYVDLTGPSGAIALEYGRSASISNGRMFIDSEYWQNKTQTGTPTGLPFGSYTFKWNYNRLGQWSCSKYNKNGCSWSDDFSVTYTYVFDWQGMKLETFPAQGKIPVVNSYLNNVQTRRAVSFSATKLAKQMIAGGYNYMSTDMVVIQRRSGTACKVTATGVRTIDRGDCKVRLTATTQRGWKYIFNFIIKVK